MKMLEICINLEILKFLKISAVHTQSIHLNQLSCTEKSTMVMPFYYAHINYIWTNPC